MNKQAFSVLLAFACLLVSGCRTSHIIVGQTRPPTNPDDVKIYRQPPKKFEEIAIIESDSVGKVGFSAQGHMDAALSRMRERAAKLGANGVILAGYGTVGSVTVGTSTGTATGGTYIGTGVASTGPGVNKAVSGVAIWVEQE
jgi:uncharacterized protein YbjQ (UPF0145 family)